MTVFSRYFRRIKFKKTIKSDQSTNVVDGMVKARKLYKELSLKIHPDRHPDKKDIAEVLMMRLVENRYNYECLLTLKEEIEDALGE